MSSIDLGDELLAQIIELTKQYPGPAAAKIKSLARAGRIAESFLGVLGGDGASSIFERSESSQTK